MLHKFMDLAKDESMEITFRDASDIPFYMEGTKIEWKG
jgi:hypothetical protein